MTDNLIIFFLYKSQHLSHLTDNLKLDMVSLLFFLFLSTFTHSISTTTASATTTLDVASSLQKTLDVLNPTLLQRQQVKTQNETTSSLSFFIRPRSSIHHDQHHHDHESLTLARLARDSHRVTSLSAKLNFAISGTNKSNSVYKVEDLTTPVTSGFSQGIGEYFARVGLGTPVQTYHMVIDTGSDITWLQCQQCFNCYQQTEPIYQWASGGPRILFQWGPFSGQSSFGSS
ncbi:putative nepenthesin [Helianthus anomalus]